MNNLQLHIRRFKLYRNQEGYADPTAGAALAHIEREEQSRAQAKRFEVVKYKLAWTNPRMLCSTSYRRNYSGNQKNWQHQR